MGEIIKKYRETGSVEDRKIPGRHRKTSHRRRKWGGGGGGGALGAVAAPIFYAPPNSPPNIMYSYRACAKCAAGYYTCDKKGQKTFCYTARADVGQNIQENERDESSDTDHEASTSQGTTAGVGSSSGSGSDRTASSESPSHTSTASSATATSCESSCLPHCCDPQRDSPHQPTKLTGTKRVQGSGKSKQARMVQVGWFKQHPWLSLCQKRQRLFCFYCQFAERRNLVTFSTKGEDSFSITGFYNWKKARERFHKHESSQIHAEACMKVKNVVDVSVMLSDNIQIQQQMRRKMLLKQLSSLKFLLRQGLVLRGHTEGEGNLLQLLLLRAEDDQDLF